MISRVDGSGVQFGKLFTNYSSFKDDFPLLKSSPKKVNLEYEKKNTSNFSIRIEFLVIASCVVCVLFVNFCRSIPSYFSFM